MGVMLMGSLTSLASTNIVAKGVKGITGSYHDFSSDSWNTSHSLCTVCHSMHNTDVNKLVPLWTHETTAQTFTMYDSPTLPLSLAGTQPSGTTKACLSCHDGITAVNSYGGKTNGTYTVITGTAAIGTDLSHNHPISFNYDSAQANDPTGLHSSSDVIATSLTAGFAGKTVKQAMLRNSTTMECSSCHDIHRQRGNSYNSGIYTVASSAYGELCLICHIK